MQAFDVAADHATRQVPIARPGDSVGQLRQQMLGQHYDCATLVVICHGERFVGALPIERLLAAPDSAVLGEIMDREAPSVRHDTDKEQALWHAVQRGEAALPVVDDSGRFVGLVAPDRLLAVLLQEHDEDLARLGGFMKASTMARLASEEPVLRRFWHRVPWLLFGLLGAYVAARVVSSFEQALETRLLLAFFIPGIVYLADAVGTQTETVVVRGLSVGVPIARIVRLELVSGLLIGCVLALIAGPVVWLAWGDSSVALVVGLALFSACSIATVVAMLFPWLFNRLHTDPAFGSGPLATVIQDLLSIVLYFAIAAAVLGLGS